MSRKTRFSSDQIEAWKRLRERGAALADIAAAAGCSAPTVSYHTDAVMRELMRERVLHAYHARRAAARAEAAQ